LYENSPRRFKPVPFWMPTKRELPNMVTPSDKIANAVLNNRTGLYSVNTFGLPEFVGARLWEHPWRVDNQSEAKVLFLPCKFHICKLKDNVCMEAYDKILAQLPLPDKNNKPVIVAPPSGRATRHIVQRSRQPSAWNFSHYKYTVEDYGRRTSPNFQGHSWIAVPYVSSYLQQCLPTPDTPGLSPSGKPRKLKVACLLGYRRWRMPLLPDCAINSNVVSFFIPKGAKSDFYKANITKQSAMDILETTTFSLQPTGDSPVRKAFFDAIGAGNIPIIFRHESFAVPLYMPFDKANGTIFLHLPGLGGDVSTIVDYVLRMPKEKVTAMQQAIHAARTRLLYSYCPQHVVETL